MQVPLHNAASPPLPIVLPPVACLLSPAPPAAGPSSAPATPAPPLLLLLLLLLLLRSWGGSSRPWVVVGSVGGAPSPPPAPPAPLAMAATSIPPPTPTTTTPAATTIAPPLPPLLLPVPPARPLIVQPHALQAPLEVSSSSLALPELLHGSELDLHQRQGLLCLWLEAHDAQRAAAIARLLGLCIHVQPQHARLAADLVDAPPAIRGQPAPLLCCEGGALNGVLQPQASACHGLLGGALDAHSGGV